jgi:hypothetical protein
MWKRRIKNAHALKNIELDTVCTKMKHLFYKFTHNKNVKAYLCTEHAKNIKLIRLNLPRENKNRRAF